MRFQDAAILITKRASEDIVRCARASPDDKLNWKPLENGRSTLDILQEVAQSPQWGVSILTARACPPFNPEMFAEMKKERSAWTTIDACATAMRENNEKLFAIIRDYPDEDLAKRIELPFMPGMVLTLAEIALTQYWNATYHLGQINYIQTLLGDFEMH